MWVPLIENNEHLTAGADYFIKKYIDSILAKNNNIDTLVLGCTHYPLLKPLLQQEAPQLQLVDSALTTAEAVAQALQAEGLLNDGTGQTADYRFYVSDIPLRFQTIGERFLGRSLQQIEMVSLG